MKLRLSPIIRMALALMVFAGCSTPSQMKESGEPASNAKAAYRQWIERQNDPETLLAYQRTTARLVEWLNAIPPEKRLEAGRAVGLSVEMDRLDEPGVWQFFVADTVPLRSLKDCHSRSGIGVPVVAYRPNDGSQKFDEFRPPEGMAVPVTAVLQPGKSDEWTLRLLNPRIRTEVVLGEKKVPLAANFTAPVATIVGHAESLRKSGFSGLINSSRSPRKEKLYLIDPYDPNRIPLIMVHGLQSTPVAFGNLVNDLHADPEIQSRYQIWHYHYPTGQAVLQNAMVFRRTLAQTLKTLDPEGDDFATNHLVILGHSMGGLLTHTLVSDSGNQIWNRVARVPVEKLEATPAAKAQMRDFFFFQRDSRVRRVIFVAVPHRGSSIADNWIGNIGLFLLHGDKPLMSFSREVIQQNRDVFDPFVVRLVRWGKFSSIRTLSRRNPSLQALADLPPQVPFHSIIGQTKPGPLLKGSDGVVPYTSSHLEGAESELVVGSGHNVFLHPEAVAEIKRILRKSYRHIRE